MGKVQVHTQGQFPGKITHVAFPVSLGLCLVAAQTEDRRTEGKERGRKEGRVRSTSYWAVIYT